MNQAVPAGSQDADIAALSTIGMRIRKAVAEGYNTGDNSLLSPVMNNGMHNPYYTPQYEQPQQQQQQNFRRMPLPGHMDQPPSLMGAGSTIDSCSNLSEWDLRSAPITTIPSFKQGKRKHEDEHGDNIEDYKSRYGPLSFNEEF